jgi:predicted metal-binding protein/SAM-dependent methyltransferase
MKLPFQEADPAHTDFQYLEDLSTAYWYSEVLFAALELKLFELLEHGFFTLEELAAAACCGKHQLSRLLMSLERLELVHQEGGKWFNSQVVRLYLVPESSWYMGDFLLYRRLLQPQWMELMHRVLGNKGNDAQPSSHDEDYAIRTLRYVRALDQLAKQKGEEIAALLSMKEWEPPVLDIGGGAGALSRAIIRTKESGWAVLFELPEVIAAAQVLYADAGAWERIQVHSGDFRSYEFDPETRFGLVVLGNFLHAYGPEEARRLLRKSLSLLATDGLLVIHDYFPDRLGRSPWKGPSYDLNMMLNTYDGECHKARQVMEWLRDEGMGRVQVHDLATDSSVILSAMQQIGEGQDMTLQQWEYVAYSEGFRRCVPIPVESIVIGSWVRMKCSCGCPLYGQNLQCPPHGMDSDATREMFGSYRLALLLEGTPPSRDFHQKLLRMEKRAFLAGFHKAFVLGAGPCPLCEQCPEDGRCRNPGQARPSMEGSGIDVYSTASQAGIHLKPVTQKDRYVKYIGLLLLE